MNLPNIHGQGVSRPEVINPPHGFPPGRVQTACAKVNSGTASAADEDL